ncbi:thymidine kinase, partial [Limosilactobacillus mucosae]|nr:thymidine kinase [Limosilactobacillus mucosae]
MAQLFFKYGAMNSGKSIDVLKVAHNYEEQGKPVVLLTSGVDTRSGRGTIASRIGLERKVYPIMKDTDVYEYVKNIDHRIYCVLIDEAQFLSKEHVLQLTRIVDELNIPVMT